MPSDCDKYPDGTRLTLNDDPSITPAWRGTVVVITGRNLNRPHLHSWRVEQTSVLDVGPNASTPVVGREYDYQYSDQYLDENTHPTLDVPTFTSIQEADEWLQTHSG